MKSNLGLIDAARGGDTKAVAQLWGENTDLVRHMICENGVSSEDDVEDISQDVFVLYQRKLPELREVAAFSTWLATITNNYAKSWQRRRHEGVPLEEDGAVLASQGDDDPLGRMVNEERQRYQCLFITVVKHAITKLAVDDQVLVEQYFVNRKPMKTVVQELRQPGLTEGACYMRVIRAIPKFAREVRKLLNADDENMRSLRQYAEIQDWLQQLSNARKRPRKPNKKDDQNEHNRGK